MGLLSRGIKVAANEIDGGTLERARQWGMSRTYHGRGLGPIRGENLRPSPNGVYGPGIYTDDAAENAARYGPQVDELMVTDRLVPLKVFDETVRRLRQEGVPGDQVMTRAIAELQEQGYEGVRDGTVRAVWSPRDVRSVNAAFRDRDSASMMAGLGGLLVGGGLLSRARRSEA